MSLETTYQTLSRSLRGEVVEVLDAGIRRGDPETRRNCLKTLSDRDCPRCRGLLIRHWPTHHETILDVIGDHRNGLASEVATRIKSGDCSDAAMQTLCQMSARLNVREALPQLIEQSWRHSSHRVRRHCVDAVLAMSYQWGELVRDNYRGKRVEPNLERRRLENTDRLLVAVGQFQKHRCGSRWFASRGDAAAIGSDRIHTHIGIGRFDDRAIHTDRPQ